MDRDGFCFAQPRYTYCTSSSTIHISFASTVLRPVGLPPSPSSLGVAHGLPSLRPTVRPTTLYATPVCSKSYSIRTLLFRRPLYISHLHSYMLSDNTVQSLPPLGLGTPSPNPFDTSSYSTFPRLPDMSLASCPHSVVLFCSPLPCCLLTSLSLSCPSRSIIAVHTVPIGFRSPYSILPTLVLNSPSLVFSLLYIVPLTAMEAGILVIALYLYT